MYILEELWGDRVNLNERGFPSKQYGRAMRRLADCEEKLTAEVMSRMEIPSVDDV